MMPPGKRLIKPRSCWGWIILAGRYCRKWRLGLPGRFVFPRPMTDRPGLDFSFSGLKTFAANTICDNGTDDQTRADIARAFEDAVVDTLMIKCKRALDQTGFKRLVMAGGVSANRTLRAKLAEMMKKRRGEVFYARPEFCTDNGAMIAYAEWCGLKQARRRISALACVRAGRWRSYRLRKLRLRRAISGTVLT